MAGPGNPVPAWMKALIVVLSLPVLAFPMLLAGDASEGLPRLLVWLYPAYVLGSAVCAWICYGRRPEVTWILLGLMVLSHVSIFYLVFGPGVEHI